MTWALGFTGVTLIGLVVLSAGLFVMLALVVGSMRVFAPEAEISSPDSGTFVWAFALAAGSAGARCRSRGCLAVAGGTATPARPRPVGFLSALVPEFRTWRVRDGLHGTFMELREESRGAEPRVISETC